MMDINIEVSREESRFKASKTSKDDGGGEGKGKSKGEEVWECGD